MDRRIEKLSVLELLGLDNFLEKEQQSIEFEIQTEKIRRSARNQDPLNQKDIIIIRSLSVIDKRSKIKQELFKYE